MNVGERIAGTLLSLAVLWWLAVYGAKSPPSAEFLPLVPAVQPAGNIQDPPRFEEEYVTPLESWPMMHAGSFCEQSDDTLAAVWYAGSREGASDVAIYFAMRPRHGTWTEPRALVTVEIARMELGRYVKKLGNPLIFTDGRGRLCLLYVSVSVGGWSGSSLNMKDSDDGGKTWTPSRRLTLSPFFNVSELLRNKPVMAQDGRIAVPIYHEFLGKFPEILWLTPDVDGQRWSYTKTRITGGRSYIQPSLICLDAQNIQVLMRSCGLAKAVGLCRSSNAGATWDPPQSLDVTNSDSALDAVRLTDGTILMAFNDKESGRAELQLAASSDCGTTWKRLATVESEPEAAEFSYPAILQSREGNIHLLYTWQRKRIKHVTFNRAWLDASPTGGSR